jgi:hypothetical protein
MVNGQRAHSFVVSSLDSHYIKIHSHSTKERNTQSIVPTKFHWNLSNVMYVCVYRVSHFIHNAFDVENEGLFFPFNPITHLMQ